MSDSYLDRPQDDGTPKAHPAFKRGQIAGTVTVPCDRCLDDVDVEVDGEEKLVVKFGNEEYDQTDEILILPIHEHELNVANYVYEFLNINMPQKRVHEKGLCNHDVIDELEKIEKISDENSHISTTIFPDLFNNLVSSRFSGKVFTKLF